MCASPPAQTTKILMPFLPISSSSFSLLVVSLFLRRREDSSKRRNDEDTILGSRLNCYHCFRMVANLIQRVFPPAAKVSGPLLEGATSRWKAYRKVIKGETLAKELFHFHERYGNVQQKDK